MGWGWMVVATVIVWLVLDTFIRVLVHQYQQRVKARERAMAEERRRQMAERPRVMVQRRSPDRWWDEYFRGDAA